MRLLGLLLLLLFCAALSDAQLPNCPTIEIIGPSGVTQPGETMTFAVTLSSTAENIKYMWTVSRGVIEKGQGTQSIVVRTSLDDERQNFIATLTLQGLPPVCNANASEIGPVAELPIGEPIDQFGVLPRNDIRGRLDNFFMELSNTPTN